MQKELTKEQRVEACLREIRRQPDFPAISQHIQQLMQALQDEDASFRYLTSLVLRDYSLTLKVLRTANSAHYNRSGRPILSVSHAVVLLGAEAIRYLASSLALFDHFRKQSPGLKELMLLSLLTANQARSVALQFNYPSREEAYLCGMLCNLGEVLIACYYPRRYASILRLTEEENLSAREACLRVLQFTYGDLGQAVAQHWNMPEPVRRCIRNIEKKPLKGALEKVDLLANLISFSHGLTAAVYRSGREGTRSRVNLLIADYLSVLPLHKEQVDRILDTALLDTKTTFNLQGVPVDSLRLSRQVEAVVAAAGETMDAAASRQVEALVGTAAETVEAAAGRPQDIAELPSNGDLLEQLTREVETLLESKAEFQLNSALMMILEAIYRGGPFDRTLFCLVTPEHTHIQGRVSLGEGAESLRERFRFSLAPGGGPIAAALRGGRELFLPGYGGAAFAEAETLKMLGAASFGLLPILVDRVLVGCLYFDSLRSASLPDAHTLELLRKLRNLTGAAIQKSRSLELA